jgi:hypothetical protein
MIEAQKKEDLNYQFVSLIFSLQQAAMAQLGKIANPASGKTEKNLVQAKATIDMLDMLKAKTQGNLTETEQKMILNSLDNLYLNYADEVGKKDGQTPAPEASADSGEKAPEEKTAPDKPKESKK